MPQLRRRTKKLIDEVRRMRKESLGWKWTRRSLMQSGGRLRLCCWAFLSECEPEGDETELRNHLCSESFTFVEHFITTICKCMLQNTQFVFNLCSQLVTNLHQGNGCKTFLRGAFFRLAFTRFSVSFVSSCY